MTALLLFVAVMVVVWKLENHREYGAAGFLMIACVLFAIAHGFGGVAS